MPGKMRLAKRFFQIAWRIFGGDQWGWSPPPYEYVYEVTTEKVHEYIGVSRDEIKTWCIVGGVFGPRGPKDSSKIPERRGGHLRVFS